MNRVERNKYLDNVGLLYGLEKKNRNRGMKKARFWYQVGDSMPYFGVGYIFGYILGYFLVMRYIAWPVVKAILQGAGIL